MDDWQDLYILEKESQTVSQIDLGVRVVSSTEGGATQFYLVQVSKKNLIHIDRRIIDFE